MYQVESMDFSVSFYSVQRRDTKGGRPLEVIMMVSIRKKMSGRGYACKKSNKYINPSKVL
jgi:hypothetical protein